MRSTQQGSPASVPRSAGKAMLGGVLTLATGLASQMLVAGLFGAGAEMDAYLTAVMIPTFLYLVCTSGLVLVLVPAFIEREAAGEPENAWALVGTFLWILTLSLSILACVGAAAAPQLIALIAPGFAPEKAAGAADMLRITLFSVPLLGLWNVAAGLQNARRRFFWPSASTAVGSLGNVIVLALLFPRLGAMSLAWANLAAAACTAAVNIVPLLRHGWPYLLPPGHPAVRRILALNLPFLIFGVFTNSVGLFERTFASHLPDGDLSYLGYAYKLSGIAVVILASAVAAAIYPVMVRAYHAGGRTALARESAYGLRLSLAGALPVVVLIAVLGAPLVRLLYQRGAFSLADAGHVAEIAAVIMTSDLLLRMLSNIIARTLYILEDTWAFMTLNALGVGVYVLIGPWVVAQWGYRGLAWAQPLQMGFVVLVSFVYMGKKLSCFSAGGLVGPVLRMLAAGAVTWAAAMLLMVGLWAAPLWLQVGLIGLLSTGVYIGLLFWADREIAAGLVDIGMSILRRLTGERGEALPRAG